MKYEIEKCPHCGSHRVQPQMMDRLGFTDNPKNMVRCDNCGFCVFGYNTVEEAIRAWNDEALKKKDEAEKKDNPYTEFAKEMRLLYEALDAEKFHDSRTAILAKMVPIVWDKVELKRARELHNVRRTARRYGRAVEESSNETSAENFVKEVNADNLLRNQETMNTIVKKGLGV